MYQWFEAKIKYDKTGDDGVIKTVTEAYLVDAMSFTEAEKRITLEMQPFIKGDFLISALKRMKIAEIVEAEWSINAVDAESNKILGNKINQSETADTWYMCKVNFVTLDEEKGVEKKQPSYMLVHANSTRTANDTLLQHLKTTMADYEVEKVAETKILDVFHYTAVA